MEGWLKLYRSLIKWQWLSSPNHLVVFIHLLIRANFRTTHYRTHTILPGQLLTGRKQLADWTGLSEMQIRTVLKDFTATQEITIKPTKLFSIITVSNWETYQCDIQEITNKQPTDNQQVTNKQPHPKKERRKEGKKERSIITISPLSFLFPEDKEIQNWLLTGSEKIHTKLLEANSHHVLVEEITKAYFWQSTKTKRDAGFFLMNWMSNKKTSAYGASKAHKAKISSTPDNPTGDPYLAELNEIRSNGASA